MLNNPWTFHYLTNTFRPACRLGHIMKFIPHSSPPYTHTLVGSGVSCIQELLVRNHPSVTMAIPLDHRLFLNATYIKHSSYKNCHRKFRQKFSRCVCSKQKQFITSTWKRFEQQVPLQTEQAEKHDDLWKPGRSCCTTEDVSKKILPASFRANRRVCTTSAKCSKTEHTG